MDAQKRAKEISLELKSIAGPLKQRLAKKFGPDVGFVLVITETGRAPAIAQYLATIDREDSIVLLQTLLERWNRRVPDVPFHERAQVTGAPYTLEQALELAMLWRHGREAEGDARAVSVVLLKELMRVAE